METPHPMGVSSVTFRAILLCGIDMALLPRGTLRNEERPFCTHTTQHDRDPRDGVTREKE